VFEFDPDVAMRTAILAISALCVGLTVGLLIFVWMWRTHVVIRATSYR